MFRLMHVANSLRSEIHSMQLRAASITSFVSLTNLRLLTFPSHARPRFVVVIAKQIALNSDFPCYFFFFGV